MVDKHRPPSIQLGAELRGDHFVPHELFLRAELRCPGSSWRCTLADPIGSRNWLDRLSGGDGLLSELVGVEVGAYVAAQVEGEAAAGSTVRPESSLPRPADHPRVGGEHPF